MQKTPLKGALKEGKKSASLKLDFETAVRLLKAGEAAALPTETVYGLGASLSAKAGLKKIFHIKKRPFSDPLIVHCRNITEALGLTSAADVSLIRLLWKNFSPGPLTLVLPKSRKVPDIVTGGQSTVALRIPSHPLIRSVLKALGQPIAAPSANMFGRASPTRAEHVLQGLKGQAPVLDGGPCSHGLESSIVQLDFLQKRLIILRPGAVSKERLNSFLKEKKIPWTVSLQPGLQQGFRPSSKKHHQSAKAFQKTRPAARGLDKHKAFPTPHPGGFQQHYAPENPLYIVQSERPWREIKAFLSQKLSLPADRIQRLPLSSGGRAAAAGLYHNFYVLSLKKGLVICAVRPFKERRGVWPAIWNRLEKASTRNFTLKEPFLRAGL